MDFADDLPLERTSNLETSHYHCYVRGVVGVNVNCLGVG